VATQENSHRHKSGTLNVLLHGAFTFIHDKDKKQIHALIPKLQEHAYRAGSWLAETELRGRGASYELDGVHPGGAHDFDPQKNLLVKFNGRLSTTHLPYATLKLPYPRKITSLRVAEVPTKYFSDKRLLEVAGDMQHVATLQVLTYDIDNENKLTLKADTGEDHYWVPAFTEDHIRLHIHSSEDYYHKPSNAQEDFNQCIALLGVELKLETRYLPASEIPNTKAVLPPGVTPKETEDLAVRTRRMARLGRLVVQDGDANLAWCETDALDGNPQACGGVVG